MPTNGPKEKPEVVSTTAVLPESDAVSRARPPDVSGDSGWGPAGKTKGMSTSTGWGGGGKTS